MSRIGKQKLIIPEKVEVRLEKTADGSNKFSIKGPLGELSRVFLKEINIDLKEGEISLEATGDSIFNRSLWGTYAAHIKNMIEGVTKGFGKTLIIEGIGYKADVIGQDLSMSLGFSHPLKVLIPAGIKVKSEKGSLNISWIDKEQVGHFAAKIRSIKPPEPYKGKGIRYDGEMILRKQGKKSVA